MYDVDLSFSRINEDFYNVSFEHTPADAIVPLQYFEYLAQQCEKVKMNQVGLKYYCMVSIVLIFRPSSYY